MATRGTHLSCPTDVIEAPVDVVWALVTDLRPVGRIL